MITPRLPGSNQLLARADKLGCQLLTDLKLNYCYQESTQNSGPPALALLLSWQTLDATFSTDAVVLFQIFTGVCSFNRFVLKWKSNNQFEPYLYKQLWEDFILKIASFRHSLRYWIFLAYHLFSLQPVINAFNLLPSMPGPVFSLLSMF